MKSILLQIVLMFIVMSSAIAQVETFEDETAGATSFTFDGFEFVVTGDLMIETFAGVCCDQSDYFLGSGKGNGASFGSFGSIKLKNVGGKFSISTLSPWCVFLSSVDGWNRVTGDIKFTGTLSVGGTIEEIFHVEYPPSTTMGNITFSPGIWDNRELVELEISSVLKNITYVAVDNLYFKSIIASKGSNIQQKKVDIYPNPSMGEVRITGTGGMEVVIMDAVGRIVREQTLYHQNLDLSELVDGVYYISISNHNQQITKRVIKL